MKRLIMLVRASRGRVARVRAETINRVIHYNR